MTRRLVLVNHPADAPAPDVSTDVVVLDTAWTSAPGDRPDMVGIRPALLRVVTEHDLHNEALALLDDWAVRADLVRRFEVDGVTWWFHARSFLRLDVHEMLAWRRAVAFVAPPDAYARIEAPLDRPNLIAALQARGAGGDRDGATIPEIVAVEASTEARRFGGGRPTPTEAIDDSPWARAAEWTRRRARFARRVFSLRTVRRMSLRVRLFRLLSNGADVVAVIRGDSFHVLNGPHGPYRGDPYISPVLDELRARGRRSAMAALGAYEPVDGLPSMLDDAGAVPLSVVARTIALGSRTPVGPEELAERLRGIEDVPLVVDGFDFAPRLASVLVGLGPWFSTQQRDAQVAHAFLARMKPRVLVTGWEAARTAWLAAARRLGIPSVAVQHGVIYRNSPDYYRPVVPGLIRPDVTCVFGDFERRLLVDECRYEPASVVATGSPRIGETMPAPSAAERAAIRAGLGVAGTDRMLVISGARHSIGEELNSIPVFARLLDGPLPGVHLVFKLHPEEVQGEHYDELVVGLARARGEAPPPMTIVRDIDLYRLLHAADAHLGIHSTVLTDAVVAGTPNMVSVVQAWSDLLGYVAAGVATPVASVDDVRAFMADPIRPTPAAREAFLRDHYEPGNAAARIAALIAERFPPARQPGSDPQPFGEQARLDPNA